MRITIKFLGRAHLFDPSGRPEWPPYPSRLFCAAVNAVETAALGPEADKALLFLESLGPPEIAASEASSPTVVTSWVPSNYSKFRKAPEVLPAFRNRQKRECGPFSVFGEVSYQWPAVDAWPKALEQITEHISRIGRSDSQVSVQITESHVSPTLVPGGGDRVLGVFRSGYLKALEDAYARGQRPASPAFESYGPPETARPTLSSTHAELIIMKQVGGDPVGVEDSLAVASAVRACAITLADRHGLLVPELHGHEPSSKSGREHCAFIALPNVGHRYADGEIKGVAVALPAVISADARWKVCRTLARIDRVQVGRLNLELEPAGPGDGVSLKAWTWRRRSQTWATVTPVLFKRRPSLSFGRSRENLLAGYCRAVGLPEPVSIECRPQPFFVGSEKADHFRLQRKDDEADRYGFHCRLEFPEEVEGPLLLGKWRHFGLGLLRPVGRGREAS